MKIVKHDVKNFVSPPNHDKHWEELSEKKTFFTILGISRRLIQGQQLTLYKQFCSIFPSPVPILPTYWAFQYPWKPMACNHSKNEWNNSHQTWPEKNVSSFESPFKDNFYYLTWMLFLRKLYFAVFIWTATWRLHNMHNLLLWVSG